MGNMRKEERFYEKKGSLVLAIVFKDTYKTTSTTFTVHFVLISDYFQVNEYNSC